MIAYEEKEAASKAALSKLDIATSVDGQKILRLRETAGLKLKGYSKKNKTYLSKFEGIKEISFNDMIINGLYPFEDKTYYKLFKSKLKAFKKQSEPYSNEVR